MTCPTALQSSPTAVSPVSIAPSLPGVPVSTTAASPALTRMYADTNPRLTRCHVTPVTEPAGEATVDGGAADPCDGLAGTPDAAAEVAAPPALAGEPPAPAAPVELAGEAARSPTSRRRTAEPSTPANTLQCQGSRSRCCHGLHGRGTSFGLSVGPVVIVVDHMAAGDATVEPSSARDENGQCARLDPNVERSGADDSSIALDHARRRRLDGDLPSLGRERRDRRR